MKKHNQTMHWMPKPPLRYGFVTGDGGRYAKVINK